MHGQQILDQLVLVPGAKLQRGKRSRLGFGGAHGDDQSTSRGGLDAIKIALVEIRDVRRARQHGGQVRERRRLARTRFAAKVDYAASATRQERPDDPLDRQWLAVRKP